MRKMTLLAALLASFSFGLFSTAAHAQTNADKKEKVEQYGYTFEDDALLGGELAGQTGIIKVRQTGIRDRLIRPRTQFVAELLKSVENI